MPIAISVVSAEALEEVGAKTGAAIQGMVPALTLNATASYGGSPVSIRGTSGLGGATLGAAFGGDGGRQMEFGPCRRSIQSTD